MIAGKDQPTGGGQRSAHHRPLVLIAPLHLAAGRVYGRDVAVGRAEVALGLSGPSAPEGDALNENGPGLFHFTATLDRRDKDQVGQRTVGCGIRAVLSADVAGTDEFGIAALHRHILRVNNRTTIFVQPFRPVELLNILRAVQKLPIPTIQDVHIAVPIGLGQGFDRLPAARDIEQKHAGVAIVVPDIVRGELEVPFDLATVRVKGQGRVRVEIIALPSVTVPVGGRVAGCPVHQVKVRVIRARHPGRTAALFIRITGPGLDAGLAFVRHGITPPLPLARLKIIGVDIAANAVFTAGNTDNDVIPNNQGGQGKAETAGIVVGFRIPHDRAGFSVKCDNTRIQSGHNDLISGQGRAPIARPAANPHIARQFMVVLPERFARCCVQGEELVIGRGEIHDAIGHQG